MRQTFCIVKMKVLDRRYQVRRKDCLIDRGVNSKNFVCLLENVKHVAAAVLIFCRQCVLKFGFCVFSRMPAENADELSVQYVPSLVQS